MCLYVDLCNRDLLSSNKIYKSDFQNYKDSINEELSRKLDNIKDNSNFIENLMMRLKKH